ncbi:MAG TPA: PspC domain-containing protein [Paludibacter sp.]
MNKKLTRSKNQLVAGVCAGIAEYFDLDITLVRAIYAILSIFTVGFPGLLLYIILWIVMPLSKE